MKKLFSILVCMIVCLAASQALAAYDFTGKSNAKMLKDMKTWTTAQEWDENLRALINTGDISLIKRSLAVAEKAINSIGDQDLKDMIIKVIGNNNALIIEHISSGYTLSLATDATAAGPVDIRDNIPTATINEEEEWVSGKSSK